MNRLVILAPNWLGDAVMALPAVADVRRMARDSHVTVAARPSVAALFELAPGVDDLIVLQHRSSAARVSTWRGVGAALADAGFDTALLLPNSVHSALIASRAGIRERWGYATAWRGSLLTRGIPRPATAVHQVEYYQRLVAALGFPNGSPEPVLSVPDRLRADAADLLARSGWDGQTRLAAIAPGAAYGGAKRWPPRMFAELISMLAADGVQSVIVGSAADRATVNETVAHLSPPRTALDLAGRTDLRMLAGVLTQCRALVTNDSGAMHLAAAAGVTVTALFGPTDDRATRPLGAAHAVLTNDVWCRPCMLRECPLDHRCMRGIGVARVRDAALRSL